MITVQVTDDDAPAEPSSGTTSVQVVNAAPVVESLLVSEHGPLVEGSLITVSGTYSDIGLRDRHTVEVYWGDRETGTGVGRLHDAQLHLHASAGGRQSHGHAVGCRTDSGPRHR